MRRSSLKLQLTDSQQSLRQGSHGSALNWQTNPEGDGSEVATSCVYYRPKKAVLIYCDWIQSWSGAEKLDSNFCKALDTIVPHSHVSGFYAGAAARFYSIHNVLWSVPVLPRSGRDLSLLDDLKHFIYLYILLYCAPALFIIHKEMKLSYISHNTFAMHIMNITSFQLKSNVAFRSFI